MGCQESYFTATKKLRDRCYTSDNERLEEMIKIIRSNGKDAYDYIGCMPVEIITLGEDVTTFNGNTWRKGSKFIYFCGKRFPQRYGNGIDGNLLLHPECNNCEHFRGVKFEGGECGPWSCRNNKCEHYRVNNISVIFTENMPPESIWKDVTAEHERFWIE